MKFVIQVTNYLAMDISEIVFGADKILFELYFNLSETQV